MRNLRNFFIGLLIVLVIMPLFFFVALPIYAFIVIGDLGDDFFKSTLSKKKETKNVETN